MSTLDRATEAVTAFAERYLRQCATPGAAIALTDAHATRATACLGFCDLEAGLRVTPQTAFGIGSVSKTLTAIAALQLRDAGLLDLDSNRCLFSGTTDHTIHGLATFISSGVRVSSPCCCLAAMSNLFFQARQEFSG